MARGLKMTALTPELELAAACCRWPRTAEGNRHVRALADSIDWPRFLRVVARHRVWGMVDDALRGAGAAPPPEAARVIGARANAAGQAGLRNLAESLRLQRVLDEAGISALFVKGEALGVRLFGRPGLKQSRDIDVLVAPPDLERAMAALAADGYVPHHPVGLTPAQFAVYRDQAHDCALRQPNRKTLVELHWRLFDNPYFMPGLGERPPAREMDVGGGASLRTLGDAELFAYLCLHGAVHGWSRLKWLAEVGAWLGAKDAEELENLLAAAVPYRADRAVGQAMLLASRLLGLALPPGLEARLRADPAVGRLAAMGLAVIAHGGGEVEVPPGSLAATRIARSHYLLGRGWRYRMSVLGRQWRGEWDRIHIPLPQPLHFLYHIIRGPSWLARRLRPSAPHRPAG